jgi:membrane protein involved in colicin uptake
MGIEAAAWATVAAVAAGTAASVYNEDRARKRQHQAADKQEAAAKKQLAAESEAQNRANARNADIEGLLEAGDNSGALGGGTTNLTGAGGASVDKNLLGKGSKLGA